MRSSVYSLFHFPNVAYLRKLAKDRKKLLLEGDPEMVDRFRLAYGADVPPSLQKIQHLTAADYGFASWSELLRHTAPPVYPPELHSFVGDDGRLKAWPAKRSRQLHFLHVVADRIKPGIVYTEPQFNTILNCYHSFNDPAMLRRDLLDSGLIDRKPDGSGYWRRRTTSRSSKGCCTPAIS